MPPDMSVLALKICWLIINFQLVLCVKDGLYSAEEDDVVPLNHGTFSAVVKNDSNIVWVVEFYNSWCGHCISFAPTWKKLATEFKDWRDLVVIAAVDCSQASNLETCRKYDISAYPTIKIFPPTSVTDGKIELIKSQDLSVLRNDILNFMLKYSPKSWPHLQPLEKIEDIWLEKKDNHKHVVLIFEEEMSPIGIQVIIDLRNMSNVLVRRMLKGNVVKYGINKFPSLYKVRPDSTYSLLVVGTKMMAIDRTAFVQTIRDLAKELPAKERKKYVQEGQVLKPYDNEKRQDSIHWLIPKKYNSSVVSLQDLESALHYSFRQEVAIRKFIDGERLKALRGFVEVALKYFPGRKPVLGFLNRVSMMLQNMKTNNITGEDWMNKIDRLQDKENYLPEARKWESCQGSSPRFRGYPCSMWTLFHTLTVAAYNQGIGARHSNPHDVLVAIRGYMKYFFGCHECSTNFLKMAHSLEAEVHTQKDSVLWLWSAHNKANKRLQGDASEDPEHPKIEFPSDKMCPQCHTVSVDGSTKPSWDMAKVLEFLVNFYSEKSIASSKDLQDADAVLGGITIAPLKETEIDWWQKQLEDQDLKQFILLQEKKEKLNRNSNKMVMREDSYFERNKSRQDGYNVLRLLGLNQIDFSLCVTFYLISTVIIITLYHHFIVRRRMVPCRSIASKLPL